MSNEMKEKIDIEVVIVVVHAFKNLLVYGCEQIVGN
jgi:hypothetical protein